MPYLGLMWCRVWISWEYLSSILSLVFEWLSLIKVLHVLHQWRAKGLCENGCLCVFSLFVRRMCFSSFVLLLRFFLRSKMFNQVKFAEWEDMRGQRWILHNCLVKNFKLCVKKPGTRCTFINKEVCFIGNLQKKREKRLIGMVYFTWGVQWFNRVCALSLVL